MRERRRKLRVAKAEIIRVVIVDAGIHLAETGPVDGAAVYERQRPLVVPGPVDIAKGKPFPVTIARSRMRIVKVKTVECIGEVRTAADGESFSEGLANGSTDACFCLQKIQVAAETGIYDPGVVGLVQIASGHFDVIAAVVVVATQGKQ